MQTNMKIIKSNFDQIGPIKVPKNPHLTQVVVPDQHFALDPLGASSRPITPRHVASRGAGGPAPLPPPPHGFGF